MHYTGSIDGKGVPHCMARNASFRCLLSQRPHLMYFHIFCQIYPTSFARSTARSSATFVATCFATFAAMRMARAFPDLIPDLLPHICFPNPYRYPVMCAQPSSSDPLPYYCNLFCYVFHMCTAFEKVKSRLAILAGKRLERVFISQLVKDRRGF